jgi:hypothetical protein
VRCEAATPEPPVVEREGRALRFAVDRGDCENVDGAEHTAEHTADARRCAGRSFHIAGGVSIAVLLDEDQRGRWWCDPWGPEADYTWSVSGTTLTLAPAGGTDACRQRGEILTGTWTRVA